LVVGLLAPPPPPPPRRLATTINARVHAHSTHPRTHAPRSSTCTYRRSHPLAPTYRFTATTHCSHFTTTTTPTPTTDNNHIGTGGASVAAMLSMGCRVLPSSGGSVATAPECKAIVYASALQGCRMRERASPQSTNDNSHSWHNRWLGGSSGSDPIAATNTGGITGISNNGSGGGIIGISNNGSGGGIGGTTNNDSGGGVGGAGGGLRAAMIRFTSPHSVLAGCLPVLLGLAALQNIQESSVWGMQIPWAAADTSSSWAHSRPSDLLSPLSVNGGLVLAVTVGVVATNTWGSCGQLDLLAGTAAAVSVSFPTINFCRE
jgi:hypothetical protein